MIAVLKRSREVGLKFNPHKAKLRVPEVSYVGHLFTADGLKPDPEKVKAINKMPAPTDKDGILCFLGTVNYLCRFELHVRWFQIFIQTKPYKTITFLKTCKTFFVRFRHHLARPSLPGNPGIRTLGDHATTQKMSTNPLS